MLDFKRAEALNPFVVVIGTHANGTGDGAFDRDGHLTFTRKGCLLSFNTPIVDCAWVELTVQCKTPAIGSTLQTIAKSLNGSFQAVNNTQFAQLGEFSETIFKIPNIGIIEELEFIFTAPSADDICSIRSIKVVRKSDNLIRKNAVIALRGALTGAGWVYNGTLGCYENTVDLGENKTPAVSFPGLANGIEYGIVRIEYNGFQASRIHVAWNGELVDIVGPHCELYYNGDTAQNVFPTGLTLTNPNGPLTSYVRIFLEIGSFITQDINAFGATPQPSTNTPNPYNPFALITPPDGWLKGVAGAFVGFGLIPCLQVDFTAGSIPNFTADNIISTTTFNAQNGFISALTATTFTANKLQINIGGSSQDRAIYVRNGFTDFHSIGYGAYLQITAHSNGAPATVHGAYAELSSPITALAYNLRHFTAAVTNRGAGSSITTVYGFYAANAIAQGTTNAGFYSDINNATNTFQLYMAGTAKSIIAGQLAIGTTFQSAAISVDPAVNSSSVFSQGVYVAGTFLAAVSTEYLCFATAITTPASTAVTRLEHFTAGNAILGSGGSLTEVRGFSARSNIAIGSNNYAFVSAFNYALNNWAFYSSGTARSWFASGLGIGDTANIINTQTERYLIVKGTLSGTNVLASVVDVTNTSTNTALFYGFTCSLNTANVAFITAEVAHFIASNSTKGAANTITALYGFYAHSSVAVGSTNYAFYTNFAAGSGMFGFYAAGTAINFFGGVTYFDHAVVEKEVVVTYSASMTPDSSLGNEFIITVTNATAMAINAPTNVPGQAGQHLEVTIRNTSGGAMGAITWNAVFKMTAFVNPATGFSRTIIFRWNGVNWVEKCRSAVDVPN